MVEQPRHSVEIDAFLTTLFSDREGYVYVPTKNPKTGFWQEYYFPWPLKKKQIVTHLLTHTKDHDCYVSPSLFKAPNAKKQAWQGTNFVWCEFDGNAPKNPPNGIPAPAIRIQSSKQGHEHWYWRLDSFETDHKVIEGLSKRLAYTLDADKSGWDCTQVLRPPGTLHKSSGKRVRLLVSSDATVGYEEFTNLVEVTEGTFNLNLDEGKAVNLEEVKLKYKWPADAVDLFNKTVEEGYRSNALSLLGFYCLEMGMTNEETFAVLSDAAKRWGKYKNHTHPQKQISDLIQYCHTQLNLKRAKDTFDDTVVFFEKAKDFVQADYKVEWIFEDFMQYPPMAVIGSLPGVGKSTMAMRLGAHLCLGTKFLKWENKAKKKFNVGYVSLEMDPRECLQYVKEIYMSLDEEQAAEFGERFHIFPLGYDLPLDTVEWQQKLLDKVDENEIDFLIIDSISAATTSSEDSVDKFFQWIRKDLKAGRDIGVLLIHHFRKTVNGEGKERKPTISDLYGGLSVSRLATSAWGLHECDNGQIEMIHFKGRMAPKWHDFKITRGPGLVYTLGKESERKEASDDEGSDYLRKTPFGSIGG